MQGIRKCTMIVLSLALLPACATHHVATKDPMAQRVASLVNATTYKRTELRALAALEALGDDGVPYLIGHLGDARVLPIQEISLANKQSDAFEGVRHYSPKVVHDALSAIVNQITGKGFEAVFNGSTSVEREADRKQWQDWCAEAYPEKIAICRPG